VTRRSTSGLRVSLVHLTCRTLPGSVVLKWYQLTAPTSEIFPDTLSCRVNSWTPELPWWEEELLEHAVTIRNTIRIQEKDLLMGILL
jgi:hypothetical protein